MLCGHPEPDKPHVRWPAGRRRAGSL